MRVPTSGWSFRQVPGWSDDEQLQRFYGHYFRVDTMDEVHEFKPWATDGSEFARRLQASLEYFLEQQPASTRDWLDFTGYQFFSEAELYGFLLDVYNYFYGDRSELPVPPDPERLPPRDDDRFWSEWRPVGE
ncbi:hypothetical protein ACH4E7_04030 [Kitasatospora sp. NPDC018058]|uniref:hypothetical protein n=1 Tax=Kitasatospora sp. NPDC018058 TaxID=3364025 RepID=UPI0037C0F34A